MKRSEVVACLNLIYLYATENVHAAQLQQLHRQQGRISTDPIRLLEFLLQIMTAENN